MVDRTAVAVTVLVACVVVALGFDVVAAYDQQAYSEYVNDSAAWCNDHGGELANSNALLHGGLHCEFDNGSSVHMSEIIETPLEQ